MKTIITLEEEKLPSIEYFNGQISRKINVSLESLIESIHGAFVEVKTEEKKPVEVEALQFSTRALPMNTVKYGLLRSGSEFLAMACPAARYDVKYHTTQFKDVGFPNLLFIFVISGKEVKKKNVFCYKDRFIRDNTKLYMYPYANVFEGGGMCFYPGNYELQDLVQLQTWPNLWRTADMNDHLYNPKRTTKEGSLRELLQDFEGKDFDHDILCMEHCELQEIEHKLGLML